MLTYLLGDVLRIFSGDFTPGEIAEIQLTQGMWLGIAILMSMPIGMIVFSVTMSYSVNRWGNIVVAIFFFAYNLIGLPTYSSTYDTYLIVVGLVICAVIVWYAWQWDLATAQHIGG